MPLRDHPAEAAPRSAGHWSGALVIGLLVPLAGLGAVLAVGATSPPDAAAFIATDAAPAVSQLVSVSGGQAGTGKAQRPAEPQPATVGRVDAAWAERVASTTGIPQRALDAYASAELALAAEDPGCGVRWNTLAAIGWIESGHGTHGGSVLDVDGIARPAIFGIPLTGKTSARITDTDAGRWDGTAEIDRAVGPLQFIPATWETWGADGNGDGIHDPQQIDDAALAAARYLCHDSVLTDPAGWRQAVFSYNHLDSYVDAVAGVATDYAARADR